MKKVLFFDIDGTLYDFTGHMPDSTLSALRQARKKGHELVICSGRSKYQVYPELFELFDGYVGAAGAYVEQNRQVIYEHFMQEDTIKEAVDVISKAGGVVAAMTEHNLILSEECETYLLHKFRAQGIGMDMIARIMGNYELTENLSAYKNIEKMLYYRSSWPVAKVAEALQDSCDITASSFEDPVEDSGEITVKNINKSLGMQKYMEQLHMDVADTIAFGDGPNDLDMIAYAGVGVAMGNAREELKKMADFVTKPVNEGGIAYAMQKLGLID